MKKQEEHKAIAPAGNVPDEGTKKKVEISKEAQAERAFLSGMLLQQTEDLVKEDLERKKKRDEEIIELNSGVKISIGEINTLITSTRQPYTPKFPNDVPFFSEIYRLNNWSHLDPNNYTKPSIVGVYISEIIYGRFSKDILPALRVLNPMLPGGTRKDKHFQYLNEDGQKYVNQYRDEAIVLMKTCDNWYDFRKKLFDKYKVPYQILLFDKD